MIENCLHLPFEGLGIVDRLSKIKIHLLSGFCLLDALENVGRIFTYFIVINESKRKMIGPCLLKTTRTLKFKTHCMIKLSF